MPLSFNTAAHRLSRPAAWFLAGAVVYGLAMHYFVPGDARNLRERVEWTLLQSTASVALRNRSRDAKQSSWEGPNLGVVAYLSAAGPAPWIGGLAAPWVCFSNVTTNGRHGMTVVWVAWLQDRPTPTGVRLFFPRMVSKGLPTYFDIQFSPGDMRANREAANEGVEYNFITGIRQATQFGRQLAAAAATHKLMLCLLKNGKPCSLPFRPAYTKRGGRGATHGGTGPGIPPPGSSQGFPPGFKVPSQP